MIWQHPAWVALLAAAFALIEGSLSEYLIHRGMHRRGWARRRHGEHHMMGTGQGWLGEFRDYVSPALPFCVLTFVPSLAIGIGFSAGLIAYLAFAAYAHQLQHERPQLVFWMKAPVHHLHHRHHMTRHNFGIGLDVWDRLFGTYQQRSWQPQPLPRDPREWLRIQWLPSTPVADEEAALEESGWRAGAERGVPRAAARAAHESGRAAPISRTRS